MASGTFLLPAEEPLHDGSSLSPREDAIFAFLFWYSAAFALVLSGN